MIQGIFTPKVRSLDALLQPYQSKLLYFDEDRYSWFVFPELEVGWCMYTDFHSSRTIFYKIAFFTILQVCSLGFQIEILGSRRKLQRDTPEARASVLEFLNCSGHWGLIEGILLNWLRFRWFVEFVPNSSDTFSVKKIEFLQGMNEPAEKKKGLRSSKLKSMGIE